MTFLKITRFTLGLLLLTTHAFAGDLKPVGTVERLINLTHKAPLLLMAPQTKVITLFEYELSEKARKSLYERVQLALENPFKYDSSYKADVNKGKKSVQLGMSKVPVLDQGVHGSCATFAATAAMDAAMNEGDYISQLCLLQLGNYLEDQEQKMSGWDGLELSEPFSRVNKYGVINIKNQKKHGCAGVKSYPSYWTKSNALMYPEAYLAQSEQISGTKVKWSQLFEFETLPIDPSHKTADKVKAALDAGNRVVFGVLLPRADIGTAGAIGWHHYFSDTWVLTPDMAIDLKYQTTLPGHGIVITGYDDAAVAMDNYGHRHHGLFTVRNSWGRYIADWGDFYMSYDYFNALAMEAYQVGGG
ncbi:MAG: peptidase C1 [Gammaproteobacteria bacterium]|nr:peptidase C1 [Gammaproteobacteria bacterium]